MPLDLSNTLVVGISATALFDLGEEDSLFQELSKEDPESAITKYRAQMLEREDMELNAGTGYPLVMSLLKLNRFQKSGEPPLVEIVVLSRNSPETGLRVLKTIRQKGMAISRSAFTGGETVTDYLEAFDVDLFLTTSKTDAQKVVDSRVCAAAVLLKPPGGIAADGDDQVRIAFDGDAVLFNEESEVVYKTSGIEAFHRAEDEAQDIPLAEGPHASLLKKLSALQERLPMSIESSPVRIAIVTARNSPAEMRVIKTLRNWGVYADEAFFLGGVEKKKVLEAFKAHIFFDDQDAHLVNASQVVPSGKVPYPSGSPLEDQPIAVVLPDEDQSGPVARNESIAGEK